MGRHEQQGVEAAAAVLADRAGRQGAGRALRWGWLLGLGSAGVGAVLGSTPLLALGAVSLAATLGLAPLGAVLGRARFRRHFRLELGAPASLSTRLQLRGQADQLEAASVVGPLALATAAAPLFFGGVIAVLMGVSAGGLGRGLLAIAHVAGPACLALALGARREARLLLGKPEFGWWRMPTAQRPIVGAALLASMILLFWPITVQPVEALVAGLYVLGTASTFLVPGLWWTRRQLARERRVLAKVALPSRFEDNPEVRPWLLEVIASTEAPTAVRIEALGELLKRFSLAEAKGALDQSLSDPALPMVTAALRLSVEHRHHPDLERLLAIGALFHLPGRDRIERWVPQVEGEALVHLCRLLRRYSDPRIEPLLLHFLQDQSVALISAAAETLGLIGSIASVEPLRAASIRGDREIIEEAVERIQIRQGGQGGALSLSGGQPGEVSLVEGPESGSLSDPSAR